MLVLRKELDLNEFENEFEDELKDLSSEGIEIVFDSLCEVMFEDTVDGVSDYLRYQMQVMSLEEVINDYGYNMDLDDVEDDELFDVVEKHLDDKTYLLGSYEEDGITYFIFDEF